MVSAQHVVAWQLEAARSEPGVFGIVVALLLALTLVADAEDLGARSACGDLIGAERR
jgi:hypothetical protein